MLQLSPFETEHTLLLKLRSIAEIINHFDRDVFISMFIVEIMVIW